MSDIHTAKASLDAVINKARVHFYKPIQIAEILYRDREIGDIDLLNLEDYRIKSRAWRDDVCRELLGRVSTSSARYQDDLFNQSALPPKMIHQLSIENRKTNGQVEAYIYKKFQEKYTQLGTALTYCHESSKEDFEITKFISSFRVQPGLKRSMDKIYEVVVYALFTTIVNKLDLQVEISIDETKLEVLKEFSDFSRKIMCLDYLKTSHVQDAKIYRVGVTNAADRGLDMYSNWGPAIQIKHLTLDLRVAEDIVSSISSDRVVIVCKDAEKDIIVSLLNQIGWAQNIQSIVTENDLIDWYEKALRGKYSDEFGDILLKTLSVEIVKEFPSLGAFSEIINNRQYGDLPYNSFWET